MSLFQKLLIVFRRLRYPGSVAYWEKRYANGGDSGAGSSGVLAAYKAAVLNQFVLEQGIRSVLEFGCGDGQQLQVADYPAYTGLDIAPSAIKRCRQIFKDDAAKTFAVYDPASFNPAENQADATFSLEVIFHLTEEKTYRLYLEHLFASARQWVVIFAANAEDNTRGIFPHFKPRRFLPDVPPGWKLQRQVPNPHADISVSEFFFFEKSSAPETR